MINIEKYGFRLIEPNGASVLYRKLIKDLFCDIIISAERYTIKVGVLNKNEIMVANRFDIKNQEQLDFLLQNGRAKYFAMAQ